MKKCRALVREVTLVCAAVVGFVMFLYSENLSWRHCRGRFFAGSAICSAYKCASCLPVSVVQYVHFGADNLKLGTITRCILTGMNGSIMVSTKGVQILKDLDNLLKCGICYEYFTTTVITPCSHNYCSICIRQSLSYRNQCPSCFEETNDSQLRPNRIVDHFLMLYFHLKDKISFNNYDFSTSRDAVSIKSENVTCSLDIKLEGVPSTSKETIPIVDVNPQMARAENAPSTPRKELRIPSMFSPKKSHTIKTNEVKVSCPVCLVEIPEKNINMHLDVCLKGMEETRRKPEKEKRKPLPKLVYNLLAEKELRKKLADVGLNTLGDRKLLVNRHKRYTVLYNAECDSLNPRPVSEIIKQVKKEEEEEKKVTAQPAKVLKLNVDRKADVKANEEAQRQYLQENKSSFEKLIEQARRNMKAKKKDDKPEDVKTTDCIILSEDSSEHSDHDFKINRPSNKRKIITSESENDDPDETAKLNIHDLCTQIVEANIHSGMAQNTNSLENVSMKNSACSGGEWQIKRPKHMLVKQDSESAELVEDIQDAATQDFGVLVHSQDIEKSKNECSFLKVSDKENDSAVKPMTNIKNNKTRRQLPDIYNDSEDEICSFDDKNTLNKKLQQESLKNQTPKKNAISLKKFVTNANSSSPVLTSKVKNNQTMKSKITPGQSGRRDLTARFEFKTTSLPSSFSQVKSPAGQESEDDSSCSDSSSNHSASLLTYTGPDCESTSAQCTPVKSPASFSPVKSAVSESKIGDFDLGSDDILKNSEDFEPLPVRRQSKRIQNSSKNSSGSKGKVVRRVRIDDL